MGSRQTAVVLLSATLLYLLASETTGVIYTPSGITVRASSAFTHAVLYGSGRTVERTDFHAVSSLFAPPPSLPYHFLVSTNSLPLAMFFPPRLSLSPPLLLPFLSFSLTLAHTRTHLQTRTHARTHGLARTHTHTRTANNKLCGSHAISSSFSLPSHLPPHLLFPSLQHQRHVRQPGVPPRRGQPRRAPRLHEGHALQVQTMGG